jgi:hypothetical protein
MPYIFSSSLTPSDCSTCLPQPQHDLYRDGPSSTSFNENQSKEDSPISYAPCAAISSPLVAGDVDAFNSSHIFSANVSLPAAGQTQPRPQFVFGGTQSPFAFNVDHLWPTPIHQNPLPAQVASLSVPDPPAVSTNQAPFLPNSQLPDSVSWACPTPSEFTSEWAPGSVPCEEGLQVLDAPPSPQPVRRSSTRRAAKKRKISQSGSDDGSVRALFYLCKQLLKLLGRQRPCFNAA